MPGVGCGPRTRTQGFFSFFPFPPPPDLSARLHPSCHRSLSLFLVHLPVCTRYFNKKLYLVGAGAFGAVFAVFYRNSIAFVEEA